MRLLTTTLLALGLTACSDSTGIAGLRLRLDVDRSDVARDGSVEVTVTATNVSSRTITVYAPESYGMCLHAFRVEDRFGRQVNVLEALCAHVNIIGPQPFDLAPGASVTASDAWEPATSTLDGEPIPAGIYRLRGHYHAGELGKESVELTGARTITVR
jgi:hypothetical protein